MDNCMAPGRDHASKALRYGTRSQGISQCLSITEEFLALFFRWANETYCDRFVTLICKKLLA